MIAKRYDETKQKSKHRAKEIRVHDNEDEKKGKYAAKIFGIPQLELRFSVCVHKYTMYIHKFMYLTEKFFWISINSQIVQASANQSEKRQQKNGFKICSNFSDCFHLHLTGNLHFHYQQFLRHIKLSSDRSMSINSVKIPFLLGFWNS